MYYRFHSSSKSNHNASGKWEHVPHTGVGHVAGEQLGEWQIAITHRKVGVSIRRDQYTVVIRREFPEHEESLAGFTSKTAALAAARKRVDLLSHIRPPRGPHRQRPVTRDDG